MIEYIECALIAKPNYAREPLPACRHPIIQLEMLSPYLSSVSSASGVACMDGEAVREPAAQERL